LGRNVFEMVCESKEIAKLCKGEYILVL